MDSDLPWPLKKGQHTTVPYTLPMTIASFHHQRGGGMSRDQHTRLCFFVHFRMTFVMAESCSTHILKGGITAPPRERNVWRQISHLDTPAFAMQPEWWSCEKKWNVARRLSTQVFVTVANTWYHHVCTKNIILLTGWSSCHVRLPRQPRGGHLLLGQQRLTVIIIDDINCSNRKMYVSTLCVVVVTC